MVDNLPNTVTPQENTEKPWGRLVSCLSTLETVDINKQSFKIGRSANCDMIIDNKKIVSNVFNNISKEHCVLKRGPNAMFYITDLSKNGTFLNGTNIRKDHTVAIKDNDKIAIGQKSLDVYIFRSLSNEDELPDTLTSDTGSSIGLIPKVNPPMWGRLVSCLLHVNSFDLCNITFKVGRSSQCDAVIDRMELESNIKNLFSKEHFIIVKDPDSLITYITDLSKCGTYLNGHLIGKNKRNILQNDDSISIGPRKRRVFVYRSMQPTCTLSLPEVLRRKYEPSAFLGKGACGEVRLAFAKYTCKMYAIKNILKGRSTTSQIYKLNHPSKIQTEINILKTLSHPFIIRMKEIVETEDEVFIVLEYMKGGELTNRIASIVPLTESNIKFFFYQMVLAVQYLHMNSITHRDLKPENVLLSSSDVETLLKVSDFGLSKVTEDDGKMKTTCGTCQYMAPEVVDSQIKEYGRQVDVWSLGVILFYMFSKRLPFNAPEREILDKLIISGTYSMDDACWNGVSHIAKDLVRKMLTVDPQMRITVNEILKHPWIEKDISMQYRVQTLIDNTSSSESAALTTSMEPPTKRVRLMHSDESIE